MHDAFMYMKKGLRGMSAALKTGVFPLPGITGVSPSSRYR